MRGMFLAILLLAAPRGGSALTWDFTEDTTWGWTAQEGFLGRRSVPALNTVRSEVADGIWRIAPVPGSLSSIRLHSPLIEEDSALFDRVTLRLRIIHHRPTPGGLQIWWFNSEARRIRAADPSDFWESRFVTGRWQLYPTEWEDITIDIRALAADPEAELIWQDTLFNFQLDLELNYDAEGPDDYPDFVEVDWIQLTGTEELLLGELPPREVVLEAGLSSALFAAPSFFPLGEGIGVRGFLRQSRGALGDVDGDGDVDLVAVWERYTDTGEEVLGWMVASNDGLGGFVPTRQFTSSSTVIWGLWGSDFDGDGLLDLVLNEGPNIELWHNQGEDGFATILQLSGVEFVGLADGDGDGEVDLLVIDDDESSHAILWLNDSADGFVRSHRFVLDGKVRRFPYLPAGQPLGQAVRLLWNRACYQPQGTWQLTRPWAASAEPPLFFEAAINPCNLHLLVDLEGDGAVDVLGSPKRNLYGDTSHHGLDLWRLDESGVLAHHSLLDLQVFPSHAATASDLTGDGLLDLTLVDRNLLTGPALVVLVGQRDGVPVVEGRYPLPGTGTQVLAGDVDGDGDDDLVVLGLSIEGGPGGVFVYINQGTPITAVASEVAVPSAFRLGSNYPNPFNPATTIPLSVPAGTEAVRLAIYNVLGQPVRQVWAGPLAAGEHRLTWDGRDGQGQPVAAGVYLYRLQMGEQTRIRKMVKLD